MNDLEKYMRLYNYEKEWRESSAARYEAQINQMQELLNESSRIIDKQSEQIDKLSTEYAVLWNNRNVHLNRKIKLYDERKELNSELTELKDEIKHLNATVNRQAATIIQYQNDLRELKSSVQPDQRSGINPNYPSCTPGWGMLGGTAAPIGSTYNHKKPRVKIVWDDYDIGG